MGLNNFTEPRKKGTLVFHLQPLQTSKFSVRQFSFARLHSIGNFANFYNVYGKYTFSKAMQYASFWTSAFGPEKNGKVQILIVDLYGLWVNQGNLAVVIAI
jgi:hypothetical protein